MKIWEYVSYEIWELCIKYGCFSLYIEKIVKSSNKWYIETNTAKRASLENIDLVE